MTVRAIITRAAEIIGTDGAWLQFGFARDPQGNPVASPLLPEATCFCILSALRRAARDVVGVDHDRELQEAKLAVARFGNARLVRHTENGWLINFNDTIGRRQSDVVSLLQGAARGTAA